jgi:hypothetical protein
MVLAGREPLSRIVVVLQRQCDLLRVVAAAAEAGRLAGRLHGRQQEADERADDRDHDQELNQGEARRGSLVRSAYESGPHGSHLEVFFLWNLLGSITPPSNSRKSSFRQLPRQQLFLSILRKSFDFS